ncbi:MAG: winged helix family transcriptional regulator [Chitinophagaceae bacterium]|nr:MAG: winged helix family transcriptional regulator [Chitinophagaceae bacterium]
MRMKRLHYSLMAVLAVCIVVIAMAFANRKTDQPDKHLEIVLRNIGHQLLLRSKDSTSRVLPIKSVNKNTFQISFENSFGFTPDTLMKLVHQQLAKTDYPGDYTVSVNECVRNQTVFAYEINSADGNLTPCRGRELKKDCYTIEISFLPKEGFNYAWLLLALVPLALLGFYLNRRRATPVGSDESEKEIAVEQPEAISNESIPDVSGYTKIGNLLFSGSTGTLRLNGETIELSEKEIKAMNIFASNLNGVVGRDLLMKAIWEDEGVVVITRNVDVLISKLRKKLGADASVKIINVHGKGYKLVTE